MAIFDFLKRSTRASPTSVSAITINSPGVVTIPGYHLLSDAPEVSAAVGIIAGLIASMPLHLMENTKKGDVRVRDQLSRKIDIDPWTLGTRSTWMQWIVETMLTEGEAVVIPRTAGGLITDLAPAPGATLYRPTGSETYYARYKGIDYDADSILHFRFRPDPDYPWKGIGPEIQLQQVVDSIIQTAQTKTSYMSSEYKPPLIFGVNAETPLSDPKERSKFVKKYLTRTDPNEPLVIPGDLMSIHQVKPLSLTDLAIKDGMELDKKTVATVYEIPPFLLGVGTFSKDEYNRFISGPLMRICKVIEQELTKKLLLSPDRYWRFNPRALYAYSLQELSTIAKTMRDSGLMTGNEARNWIGLPPKDGLDELVMLENYIPTARLGDQSKLTAPTEKEEPTNETQ